MKKISFILIRTYQIFLIGIFFASFYAAINIGNQTDSAHGEFAYRGKINEPGIVSEIGHGAAITSGFDGGALGMSLLSATCLFLIPMIELKLYQQNVKGNN